MKGLTNSYCSGSSCVITPPATPCDTTTADFSLQYFFMGVGLFLATFFFCRTILFPEGISSRIHQIEEEINAHRPFHKGKDGDNNAPNLGKSFDNGDGFHSEHSSRKYSTPLMHVASATWSSVLLLGLSPYIQQFFFGDDYDVVVVSDYLNTTAQSLLAVLGVIYGLIVSQFLQISDARLDHIRTAFAAEIAGLTRICQVIATIKSKDQAKRKLLEVVVEYTDDMNEVFEDPRAFSKYSDLGKLFQISPLITELLSDPSSDKAEFSVRALDMTDDIVNSITEARCK